LGRTIKKPQSEDNTPKPEIAADEEHTEKTATKTRFDKANDSDTAEAKQQKKTENKQKPDKNSTNDRRSAEKSADETDGNSDEDNGNDYETDSRKNITSDPLESLKTELTTERDKYLRLAAEYDNFRKRSIKEQQTVYSDAKADTIIKLLPVYDNLERALKMECVDEPFYKGVEMTMTQLTEILENMDVRMIDAKGETFDPNKHNAVVTIENPELGEKIVADEIQKGFMLGDKVIRFSSVVVAN